MSPGNTVTHAHPFPTAAMLSSYLRNMLILVGKRVLMPHASNTLPGMSPPICNLTDTWLVVIRPLFYCSMVYRLLQPGAIRPPPYCTLVQSGHHCIALWCNQATSALHSGAIRPPPHCTLVQSGHLRTIRPPPYCTLVQSGRLHVPPWCKQATSVQSGHLRIAPWCNQATSVQSGHLRIAPWCNQATSVLHPGGIRAPPYCTLVQSGHLRIAPWCNQATSI